MDSLSQIALGSAVAIGVMGRRTAVWKAALWGAVGGTLPDLDAFIDRGDPVSDMTLHRTESHALFWLTLAAPLLAGLAAAVHGELDRWRRWWLALWLVLITHPLLDVMTIYGTQLGLPFTNHPYAVGSMFIIDPLYTLPLLVGVIAALAGDGPAPRVAAGQRQALYPRREGRLRWNRVGLALSTAYLAWSMVAQQIVKSGVEDALEAEGRPAERLLVTPAPFNTLLWRVVAVEEGVYREGFVSLLDGRAPLELVDHDRGPALIDAWREVGPVARMAWFTQGIYRIRERDGRTVLTDLRMGQGDFYTFNFDVGRTVGGKPEPARPAQITDRPDVAAGLKWLARRIVDPTAEFPFARRGDGPSPSPMTH